jgi:hypothetical protein
MVSGFLGSTFFVVLLVLGLISGSLSVLREVQLMYFPAKAKERSVFWAWVRIAVVIAAIILWTNEHSKVSELSKQLEEPIIRLGPVRLMTPEERPAFVDPDTHNPNWAVEIPLSTSRKLTNACISVKEISGPNKLRITTPRNLGWKHDINTFDCIDIVNRDSFVLFHTQVAKDNAEDLRLFVQPGPYTGEYTPMLRDIKPGKYQITIELKAHEAQQAHEKILSLDWSGNMENGGFKLGCNGSQTECEDKR